MVEVDPDGVREVGSKYYPALADVYKEASETCSESRETVAIPEQEHLETAIKNYLTTIVDFLSVSDSRLRECGDTLVEVADSLTDVDDKNADSIAEPVEGMPEDD